jgi:hypothetical protein
MTATPFDERVVFITFTMTTEYSLESDMPEVAKVLGMTTRKLAKMIDDGSDLGSELDGAAISRLKENAEVTGEEFEIDEVGEET